MLQKRWHKKKKKNTSERLLNVFGSYWEGFYNSISRFEQEFMVSEWKKPKGNRQLTLEKNKIIKWNDTAWAVTVSLCIQLTFQLTLMTDAILFKKKKKTWRGEKVSRSRQKEKKKTPFGPWSKWTTQCQVYNYMVYHLRTPSNVHSTKKQKAEAWRVGGWWLLMLS